MRYVVYDFESTGLDVLNDRAVEVAAVIVEKGKVVDTYTSLINCGKPCSPDAFAAHRIEENVLRKAPSSKKVFEEFAKFIDGHYIVAHNGNNFDHYILRTEILRHSIPMPKCKLIDSYLVSASIGGGAHNMEALCKRLGVNNKNAHRALADTEALVEVFELLNNRKVDLANCHKISKSHILEQFFPDIIGFNLLLKGLQDQKKIEVSYQKENEKAERRWIIPVRGDKKFNGPLQVVSVCCRDEVEKNFRFDRIKEIHSVEE